MVTEKCCTKCGVVKPLSEFSKSKQHKYGHTSQCKACRRQYYQDHKAETSIYNAHYRKEHMDEDAERSSRYYKEHKEELLEYQRQYRKDHKEELAEKALRYCEDHRAELSKRRAIYNQTQKGKSIKRAGNIRRRSPHGAGRIRPKVVRSVIGSSDGQCPYCGKSFTDGHIDHIIPLSRGGTNERVNLIYCCATCNMLKSDKSLEEFMLELNYSLRGGE